MTSSTTPMCRRWGAVLLSLLVARPAPTSVPNVGPWGERRRSSRGAGPSTGFWDTVPTGPARPAVSTRGWSRAPAGARPVLESLAPFGTVRRINWTSDTAPLVVHLQDVHANEGAQRNIGRALARLMERAPVDVLALEGAFGPLDIERFRRFADRDAVSVVADRLLVEGRMSGPVHAVLTSTAAAPAVRGVDDPDLHAANVEAYRRAEPLRGSALAAVARERAALAAAPAPAGLRALDAIVIGHHAGRVGLGPYVEGLFAAAGDAASAPTARLFVDLLARERRMDFPGVAEERRRFLETLIPRLTPAQSDRLVAAAVDHREGVLSHAAFYGFLEDLGRSHGVDFSGRIALHAYVRYVRQADAIDAEALHAELPRLEDVAYRRAATGPGARRWAALSRRVTLYEKLADFALTPLEWRRLRTEPGVGPDGVDWSPFRAFYERADDRDQSLAAAVSDEARPGTVRRIVLVTGGYHAAGVRAALVRAGLSVIEFVPRVDAVDRFDGVTALSAFDREKTPLEKLFRGDRLFLAPAPFAREDQERARATVPLVRELRDPSVDYSGESRDLVELSLSDSPPLTVEAADEPGGGAVLSVRNESTGEEVRVAARLDENGRLVDVRESTVVPGWGRAVSRWMGRGRAPRARVAGAGLLLWGDGRRLARARARLSQGRGAALTAGERRRSAREWTEELRAKGSLREFVFFGAADRAPGLDRALRAAVALFQTERPLSRDGRPIEFWAVDPEGLDAPDRGVALWEDSAERRTLRFRRGDLAAVQRALLTEEILPDFGPAGPSRAVDREIAAALAEDVLTEGIHLLPGDPWGLRDGEEARFRELTPAQHDRALRAAGRLRGRLPGIFASGASLAEEYWAVRTERLRDAGPRRRPALEGLVGWYGRARDAALRGDMTAGFVAREEVRVRFHRLAAEAGVATHLAPNGLSFGLQEGVSRLAAAVGLLSQARAAGGGQAAGSPTVVNGVSQALIDLSGPFVLYQKLPNGRDAFPVWLEGIHRRVTGSESPAANGVFFESLARALPTDAAAFARRSPGLVDFARLYLEGALSFNALQDAWESLFRSAERPPGATRGGLRTLLVTHTLGTPVGESFDRGAEDLAKILLDQAPVRFLGRGGWERLSSLEGAAAVPALTGLFWAAEVPDTAVSLEEGVDLLFKWIGGESGSADPESALRDHVLGWRLSRQEATAALPRLETLARAVLAEVAPSPAYEEVGSNVFEDMNKGGVDPAARAARWLQALGFLTFPGRFDPTNPEEPNPDMDLRVFGNSFRRVVFSADAVFAHARAVREVLRWERGERGVSSSRRVRRGDERFPWTGLPSRGQFPGAAVLAAVAGAGLWAVPGSASAAGLALPAFVDALWPIVALLAGAATAIHGVWRAYRAARDVPRRAASALGAAVAARSVAPLGAVLDELEAAPLSLDAAGSAALHVVRERGWERRSDFVETARAALRGQGVGMDFASVRAALAAVFTGDFPTSANAPVLRVWLADAALAGRVPRNPGVDVLIVALDDRADRTLRAAGHAPASGSGLVRAGALSLGAVERFVVARGYDPSRFAACRVMVPMGLPIQTDGARTDLFQRAIVVLMDALRGLPLRAIDLDALDRVARAIASAA